MNKLNSNLTLYRTLCPLYLTFFILFTSQTLFFCSESTASLGAKSTSDPRLLHSTFVISSHNFRVLKISEEYQHTEDQKKKNGKEKSMHESRKPLIWYRASVQTGTQASPAVGIVSRQKPTMHHQIQAATREMLVLTFSPFRNWQIESTLNSLRRPHSLLQTGRKSQLAVCAHGKTSPYPAGQACSFMRARIAKGAQKHILEGISVPSMRATFIFLYWWDLTSGIFCKTSSEIITKDWIQACFCKEGQSKPSCTDNKCQRQWKHFSFRERRQKKTTTKKKYLSLL